MESAQYTYSLKDTGVEPLLIDCLSGELFERSNSIYGRFFTKSQLINLVKCVRPEMIVNIREESYFEYIKHYLGIIDVNESENNLELLPNEKILEIYHQHAEHLRNVFSHCGHTEHKIITSKFDFNKIDLDKHVRFFREERIFQSTTYNPSGIRLEHPKVSRILKEFVKKEVPSIHLSLNCLNTLMNLFKENPVSPSLNPTRSEFFPAKMGQFELFLSSDNADKYDESEEEDNEFKAVTSSYMNPFSFTGSNKPRKGSSIHFKEFSQIQKVYRIYENAYFERWGNKQQSSIKDLHSAIKRTQIPPVYTYPIKSHGEKADKLHEVYILHPRNLAKSGKDLFEGIKNIRLSHNFQIESQPQKKADSSKFLKPLICKKGYQYVDYTQNIDAINVNAKYVSKKPIQFGKISEISKYNLNFFLYTYNICSSLGKDFVVGHKLLYNSETIDWNYLDNFKISLFEHGCDKTLQGINGDYTKYGFCLSIIVYRSLRREYPENVMSDFLQLLNTQIEETFHENPMFNFDNSNSVGICALHIPGFENHETLYLETYKADESGDSIGLSIYWLSASSYNVHIAKYLILQAAKSLHLNFQIFNYKFERILKIIELEPSMLVRKLSRARIDKSLQMLRELGFIFVSFENKSQIHRFMLHPDMSVWITWSNDELTLVEFILEEKKGNYIDLTGIEEQIRNIQIDDELLN